MDEATEQTVAVVWLVDVEGLSEFLTLTEVEAPDVEWDEFFPEDPSVNPSVQIVPQNNCAVIRSKASMACSFMMAGLAASWDSKSARVIEGTELSPIAMLHGRAYPATLCEFAAALSSYDMVIGQEFKPGVLTGPKANIGRILMHVQEGMYAAGFMDIGNIKAWEISLKTGDA